MTQNLSNALIVIEAPGKLKKYREYTGMTVIATGGHFRDLPAKGLNVDLVTYEANFDYLPAKGKGMSGAEIAKKLKSAAKGRKVYIATDKDREGYAIGKMVYDEVKKNASQVYRMEVGSITPAAIKQAMETAVPFEKTNPGLFNAFLGRRIGDRLVGYLLSPAARDALNANVSVGRVQSPALWLVVARERERRAFIPAPYWTLTATFEANGTIFTAKHEKLVDENEKNRVFAAVSAATTGEVVEVEKKETATAPPAPFTTVDLQTAASSSLNMSPERTMQLAQDLYQKGGLITYHRTDDSQLDPEFVIEMRRFLAKEYGDDYIPAKPPIHHKKNSQAEAHEGIRPTYVHPESEIAKKVSDEGLSEEHRLLYELIWRRAMASQMAPARHDVAIIELDVGSEEFVAKGRVLTFPGFLAVAKVELKEADATVERDGDPEEAEAAQILPDLVVGSMAAKNGEKLVAKKTTSPARYSEATLLRTLERHGIGRPATYAAITSNIIDRGYVIIEKKRVVPTSSGEALIEWLEKNFPWVVDLNLTKTMEDYLDTVAEGQGSWQKFAKGVHSKTGFISDSKQANQSTGYPSTTAVFPSSDGNNIKGKPPVKNSNSNVVEVGLCPACGKPVVERSKSYSCSGTCGFTLWKDSLSRLGKPQISISLARQLIKGPTVLQDLVSPKNPEKKFNAKGYLAKDPTHGWRVKLDFG